MYGSFVPFVLVGKTRLIYSLVIIWSNGTDFEATYEETSTTAVSADPAITVPLLTVNSWIMMQRKAPNSPVSFNKNWAEYRDGFGSLAVNVNYWLGLEKVYRLVQLGSLRLRVEVDDF